MNAPTFILLALSPDGTSRAYELHGPTVEAICRLPEIPAISSGIDRGSFQTYEVGGFSVDIVALPQIAREHSDT